MTRDYDSISVNGFTGFGDDTLVTAPTSPFYQSLWISYYEVNNNSGSSASCGVGYKLADADWSAGQIDDSATPDAVDDTTDAQDAGTDDFALTTTTNNDGFYVAADRPFNLIGITVSTAEAGSPTYEYSYYNGTAFATFTPIVSPDFTGTGDTMILFPTFNDWATGATAAVGTFTDQYVIRVRATTAPSTAPLATKLWVAKALDIVGTVADGSSSPCDRRDGRSATRQVPPGYSLVPICSQSSSKNVFTCEYFFSS